eukprot:m.251095 g.251095  ORF g.251095 m.251095 type:complete len:129 (+) comp10974_c0_seq85:3187-3573(+)
MGSITKVNGEVRQRITSKDLTEAELSKLMHGFVETVKEGNFEEKGWTRNTYATSKIGVTALTKIFARNAERGIQYFPICPGWIKTDMGGENASKTVDEGADTAVWLATTDEPLQNGRFYAERQVQEKF